MMRRKDREVTDPVQIAEALALCDVCRVGLNTEDGYPYILPLNFGYEFGDEGLVLYFHSALEGYKHELMRRDPRASFEMDCMHDIFSVEERGYCTMNYFSIMGRGRIEYVEDEAEKLHALTLLTDRYHTCHFEFNRAAMPRTSVYRLVVECFTAKHKSSHR